MGRLPATYGDRPIMSRAPYEMYGELAITTNQIPTVINPALFQNPQDKPFEVHRMIPRFLAQDAEGIALPVQPDQSLLAQLVKITIADTALNYIMTKAPTRPENLVKGTSERTWEWADPYYLVRSNGFEVTIQGMPFPAIDDLVSILVCISFEGFTIVIHPPTNNR